ncbi:MAG TPA: hypothetical protein VJH97_06520 [Candidatus Nanoarchaeia archaeon]|nr:hypothetical protein [Candidatus Nanoarchaeia archaeon]
MAGIVHKRAQKIDKDILQVLDSTEKPISTRDLGSRIGRAWHSVQSHCLKLQLAGKIKGYKISNINVWERGES